MIYTDKINSIRNELSRFPQKVTLVAASKMQSKETIDEFMELAPDFILGENRVQELLEKYDPKYTWHFIGQLQTNKVKYIIDKVELIHSLDREDLAKEIEKQAMKHNKIQHCLIEINMGTEITKGGVEPDKVLDFIKSLNNYPHIHIDGIMSVLPQAEEKELGVLYDRLYAIYEDVKKLEQENLTVRYLSAGMSGDYLTAVSHGANMIRLGRIIFGERNYNKV